MNNTPLEKLSLFTDLGLVVDSKLSWNEHITYITSNADQRLGFVKRTLRFNINQPVKLQCYKTLVQPVLGYCTPVWSDCNRKNIEKVESIQRRATKCIMNDFQQDADNKTHLDACNILPLTYRRTYLDLTYLLNIYNNNNC